jgi:excisionase family DNA binding protein
VIGDPILVDPTEVRERCECHVCETLRGVLAANLDAVHDRRVVTPMLLTVSAAAELLGVSDGTVAGLIADGEIRPVHVRGFGQRRIPRVELDEFVSRLVNGQVRRWVEARRELDRWGLRYMGDERRYLDKNGRGSTRVATAWHLGDGRATLCGTVPEGRWRVTTEAFWVSRMCKECEAIRSRMRLERDAKARRSPTPRDIQIMLTVVETPTGLVTRRAGWHLGDGKTTLCGLTREQWASTKRRPKRRGCAVCQKVAGLA